MNRGKMCNAMPGGLTISDKANEGHLSKRQCAILMKMPHHCPLYNFCPILYELRSNENAMPQSPIKQTKDTLPKDAFLGPCPTIWYQGIFYCIMATCSIVVHYSGCYGNSSLHTSCTAGHADSKWPDSLLLHTNGRSLQPLT